MIKLEYFTRNDFNQLIEWVNTEDLLTNWAGSLFKFPLSEAALDWYIEGTNDMATSDVFVYKGVDSDTGETLGHISVGSISHSNKTARISRVLVGNTKHRGKGICTGMLNALLKITFEEMKLHRVSLGVYDFNHAAIRCYEKCGFMKEGLLRDVLRYGDDNYWSLWEMSILEHEWREKK